MNEANGDKSPRENRIHEWLRKANSTTDAITSVFESVAEHLRRGEFESKQLLTPTEFRLTTKPIVQGLIRESAILSEKLKHTTHRSKLIDEIASQLSESETRLSELVSPESLVEENPVWHDQVQVQATKTLSALKQLNSDMPDFSREPIIAVRNAALNIERLVCLHELLRMRGMVFDLKLETKSLSEYLKTGNNEIDPLITVDVAEVLDVACDEILSAARAKDIEMRRIYEYNQAICKTNPKQLLIAFGNLLDNAVKYSWRIQHNEPIAAWVTIRIITKDASVRIEIESWGLPIPREEIETGIIFERNQRGRLAKLSKVAGTGNGLSIVREIVNGLGGSVRATSKPAKSGGVAIDYRKPFITTFVLTLPRS